MGYARYYSTGNRRWQGYAVAARCEHPGCRERIDRGLAYACGEPPDGGDHGCGGSFCEAHRVSVGHEIVGGAGNLCRACYDALPDEIRARLDAEDDAPAAAPGKEPKP